MPAPASSSIRWAAEYWITWLTNGIVTAGTATLIYWLVVHLTGVELAAMASALAYGLATIAFPYATLFYGHATAGLWALLTVYWLARWPDSRFADLLAGVTAGLATFTEYTLVVLPVSIVVTDILLGLFAAGGRKSGLRLGLFVLGGLPLALLLGLYHYHVTGSPFRFPYSLEVHEELFGYHKEGYGIPISLPDWDVAHALLAGTKRGILWFSPVVIGALPGFGVLCRSGHVRLVLVGTGTFLGLFFINAGFPTWDGGWGTGTRFLLPSFPLLLVITGAWLGCRSEGWIRYLNRLAKGIWGLAAVYGFAIMLGCTLTGVRFPPGLENPLIEAVIPSLQQGRLVDHAGQWLGSNARSGGEFLVMAFPCIAAIGLLWLAYRGDRQRSTTLNPVAR